MTEHYEIKAVFPPATPAFAVFEQAGMPNGEYHEQVEFWALVQSDAELAQSEVEGMVKSWYGEKDDPWHFELACTCSNFLGYRDGVAK